MRGLAAIRGRLFGLLARVRTTPRHRAADRPALHVVSDEPPRQIDNRNALTQFWRTEQNDEIGGWCVVVNRQGTPATGNPSVASFVHEQHARHIAELHNEWLDRHVRNL